jgi:SAM-dependent methyltransferase
VCAADDFVETRGKKHLVARDNVILELGFFLSRLGRDRVALLLPEDDAVHVPSDLNGILYPMYQDVAATYLEAEISYALSSFKKVVRALPTVRQDPLRTSAPFDRCRMRSIDRLLDCAIYVQAAVGDSKDELRNAINEHHIVPMKYLYMGEEGCRAWLDMCRLPQYKFWSNSVDHLSQQVSAFAREIKKRSRTQELDIISLGCGNGQKDRVLLQGLVQGLHGSEKLSYFPIDISAKMLVEGVRTVMGDPKLKDSVEVKGVIGDFTALKSFEPIYEVRARGNVFSILGNTLGNSSEDEIFSALREAMFPGDFVLIEANVDKERTNTTADFLDMDVKIKRDLLPLKYVGEDPHPGDHSYEWSDYISSVQGAATLMGVYRAKDPEKRVILSMIHHYPLQSLIAAIEERLDVLVVAQHAQKGVALILAYRPDPATAQH